MRCFITMLINNALYFLLHFFFATSTTMSVEITAAGKIVGGHVMVQTLLPRVVDGDLIKQSFDGNDEFPERITATTPTGQLEKSHSMEDELGEDNEPQQ